MIATIKAYASLIKGALIIGVLAYIKYLRSSNKEQKENISRLKREVETRKEIAKDEVKKAVFDTMQKERAKELRKTEVVLDEIEGRIKEYEDDYSANGNDDTNRFKPTRV